MANTNWYERWNTRWNLAKERENAAQLAVDDAFERDASYSETMALIAYKANEWQYCKQILDELLER